MALPLLTLCTHELTGRHAPMNSETKKPLAYDGDVRLIRDYGSKVVELLGPCPGELILDIGCGDGELSSVIKRKGATVRGMDTDPAAVAIACTRGIEAVVADARYIESPAIYDAVFSHASIHWMQDGAKVFSGAWAALKPKGRFVAETGAHRNIAAIQTAMLAALDRFDADPAQIPRLWFPTADECCDLLEASGFVVRSIQTFPRPAPLPKGIDAYFNLFGKPFFNAVAPELQDQAKQLARKLLEPVLRTGRGDWIADYVHLRFAADKVTPLRHRPEQMPAEFHGQA